MSENNFWSALRKRLAGHWTRVTDKLQGGIPDTWFCLPDGTEGGIELKFIDERALLTPTGRLARVKIGLRTEQSIWLHERSQCNGRCGILVRVGNLDVLLFKGSQALDLMNAYDIQTLRSMAFRRSEGGGVPNDIHDWLRALK